MRRRGKRLGLALGGGGARGLAHIGVLKVFEREHIPVDVIVGTSMGALVGGAYAAGTGADELERKAYEFLGTAAFQNSAITAIESSHTKDGKRFSRRIQEYLKNRFYVVQAMFRPGILSSEEFSAMINYFIPDISVSDTRVPFRAVATDLVSGEQVTFSSGSLRQAVLASSAVPGAVEPLREGARLFSDGGIICLIPSTVARKEGADMVVAVAVDHDICSEKEFRSAMSIYQRVSDIMAAQLRHYELVEADVVIQPEVGDVHWTDFSQARNMVEAGESAAELCLPRIRAMTPGKKRWFTFSQLLQPCRQSKKSP